MASKTTSRGRSIVVRPTPEQLHREHRAWLGEDALWRDQIRAWQSELKQSAADLKKVEKALDAHAKALARHAAAIRLYEQSMLEHEHLLVQAIKGGNGQVPPNLMPSHDAVAIEHSAQREQHERIKQRHHTVLAHLRVLSQALSNVE
ncbi:MAG: hypothetical protein K1X74_07010 [Pirellulales bacterium]|nr:hypothetical protein [Pirellulales bacterium]